MGLYAYASGAHRQVLTVLSHLGITCSYPTLTGTIKLPSGEELRAEETEEGTPTQTAHTDGTAASADKTTVHPLNSLRDQSQDVQAERTRHGVDAARGEGEVEAGARAEKDREHSRAATNGKY